jgi:hypothetical protein
MTIRLVSEVSNIVRFPGGRQERPSIEQAARLDTQLVAGF